MKKKIRYDRLIFVGVILAAVLFVLIYLMINRVHVEEYQGRIDTFVASYRQDDKVYTFDLKSFEKDGIRYASLNDIYNLIVILDKQSHVYIDQNKHILIYELSDGVYQFDYGRKRIVYNNDSIDLKKNKDDIYISHKNVYISVSFIEKILLKNKKSIKFENKNAIIS